MERRTWEEWDRMEIEGLRIVTPDGFRTHPADALYTRDEFLIRRGYSTCRDVRAEEHRRAAVG